MGNGFYIVEISSNSQNLYITAFNIEFTESLMLQINALSSKNLLKKFDYDFE